MMDQCYLPTFLHIWLHLVCKLCLFLRYLSCGYILVASHVKRHVFFGALFIQIMMCRSNSASFARRRYKKPNIPSHYFPLILDYLSCSDTILALASLFAIQVLLSACFFSIVISVSFSNLESAQLRQSLGSVELNHMDSSS